MGYAAWTSGRGSMLLQASGGRCSVCLENGGENGSGLASDDGLENGDGLVSGGG